MATARAASGGGRRRRVQRPPGQAWPADSGGAQLLPDLGLFGGQADELPGGAADRTAAGRHSPAQSGTAWLLGEQQQWLVDCGEETWPAARPMQRMAPERRLLQQPPFPLSACQTIVDHSSVSLVVWPVSLQPAHLVRLAGRYAGQMDECHQSASAHRAASGERNEAGNL